MTSRLRALPQPNEPTLRIVTVGKTGSGKSAVGNTLLGMRAFESRVSVSAVTSESQMETGAFGGQQLEVVDTPGLFNAAIPTHEVITQITRCFWLSAPGPHVILVVMALNRVTPEEQETLQLIKQIFGEQAARYTMVLFTHGDDLEADGTSVEELIGQNRSLSTFINQCGRRFHVFNNRSNDPAQVRELLEKINTMIRRNGGGYFTNEMFRQAERVQRQGIEQLQRENPHIAYEEAVRQAQGNSWYFQRFMAVALAILAFAFVVARESRCSIQ